MFSKYEVYTSTQSIYCYPESCVLKNKLDIRDYTILKQAEEEITAVKQFALLQNPIKGRFSKTHLLKIHRFIFGDIYGFAGKIRKEQISKADTAFYPPNLIDRELNSLFSKIKSDNMLKNKNEDSFIESLAYIFAELNIIHPFREGNGRTIREFIRFAAKVNGLNLNWGNVDKNELLDAFVASVDDFRCFIPVLEKAIDKQKGKYI